jgi:methionyl-tRNA synthetase
LFDIRVFADANFDWVDLVAKHNNELLNNLGNFCLRAGSFCKKTFKGQVPQMVLQDVDLELIARVNEQVRFAVQLVLLASSHVRECS